MMYFKFSIHSDIFLENAIAENHLGGGGGRYVGGVTNPRCIGGDKATRPASQEN